MTDFTSPPPVASGELADRLGAALQAVVDAEAAIGGEGCTLRVEVPTHDLAVSRAAGGLWRGGPPMTPDSPFRIASVTKPFTAVVITQLVAEGSLGLDEPMATHLPASVADLVPALHVLDGVSSGERITVRQLLTHSSGLFDYAMSPEYFRTLAADPGHVWTPREMIEGAIAWGTPHFPPGGGYGYAYSDTGYVLLGTIIEHLDGRPLHAAYRARILDPLGMHGTYLEGFEEHRGSEIAHAYQGDFDVMPLHGSADWAGGGLVSDTTELAVFARALVDGTLVARPLFDEMLQWRFRTLDPTLHSPGFVGYGFGVEARVREGIELRGHRGHWGVVMHVDPRNAMTVTGTIDQADRRPDALLDGALAAVLELVPDLRP